MLVSRRKEKPMEASAIDDFGTGIKNHFGLLTNDLSKVNGSNYRNFLGNSYSSEEAAKKLNKSRASVYKDEIKVPKDFIESFLVPLVIASDYAYILFDENDEKAKNWMLAPNTYFFGKSPFNLCLAGEGREVISFLKERLGE